MIDELDFVDDGDFGVVAVDFDRKVAQDLYRAGFSDPQLAARWDRIKTEVPFVDVVEATHGERVFADSRIACPFHRNDRPSFRLYKRSNDAYCYACPEGSKLWDSVRFVCAKFGYTRKQGIQWLEKKYDLPPMEDIEDDEEEELDEEGMVTKTINFNDLADPYIAMASAAFLAAKDPDLAREYIEIFFDCVPARNADPNSEDELKKCMPLARVLGSEAIEAIKKRRFA